MNLDDYFKDDETPAEEKTALDADAAQQADEQAKSATEQESAEPQADANAEGATEQSDEQEEASSAAPDWLARYGGEEDARRRLDVMANFALGDEQDAVELIKFLNSENPEQLSSLAEIMLEKYATAFGYTKAAEAEDEGDGFDDDDELPDDVLERVRRAEARASAAEKRLAEIQQQDQHEAVDERAEAFGAEVNTYAQGLIDAQNLHPEAADRLAHELSTALTSEAWQTDAEKAAVTAFTKAGMEWLKGQSGAQKLAMLGLQDAVTGLLAERLPAITKISNALKAQEAFQAGPTQKAAAATAIPAQPTGAARPEIGTDHIKPPRGSRNVDEYFR